MQRPPAADPVRPRAEGTCVVHFSSADAERTHLDGASRQAQTSISARGAFRQGLQNDIGPIRRARAPLQAASEMGPCNSRAR